MLIYLMVSCATSAVVDDGVKDGGTDTSADSGGEPQPETVWEQYEGSRTYVLTSDYYSCEESTEDEGEELLEGDEFDQVKALCSECEHVFENDPVESSLCYTLIPLPRNWRSIDLNEEGTGGTLSFYMEGDAGLELWASSEVEFDGSLMPFAYSLPDYYLDVSGEMVFEYVLPE